MIALNGTTVIFASCFIRTPMKDIDQDKRFTPFHKEQDGIYCYTEDERNQVVSLLKELNAVFAVEPLEIPKEHKDKTINMRYNSRTEAIKHINGEIEAPEQEMVTLLKQEQNILRDRLNNVEAEKDSLKDRLNNIETEERTLKDRLNGLESENNSLKTKVNTLQTNNETLLSRINLVESSLNTIKKDIVTKS
jgi:chromosome segregation ATPase